jgi:hypothetical protein
VENVLPLTWRVVLVIGVITLLTVIDRALTQLAS